MSSCWRMATFQEMWPDWDMGVKRMPARERRGRSCEKRRAEERGRGRGGGRTLEADFVALQALHSLLEEVFAGRGHARDVVLVPLDGGVDILEYFLDGVRDFSTDTVTGDEGDLEGENGQKGDWQAGTMGRTVCTPPYFVGGWDGR